MICFQEKFTKFGFINLIAANLTFWAFATISESYHGFQESVEDEEDASSGEISQCLFKPNFSLKIYQSCQLTGTFACKS